MHLFTRAVREPIFHFLVIGTLLFGLFALVSDSEAPHPEQGVVSIGDAEVTQLISQFRQTWRRAPTQEELTGLVQGYVREEVLVREALSLSMDVDDPVIRRRLAQKMEFLIASSAASLAPSEEALQRHYEANIGTYAIGAQIAFEQLYLGPSATPDYVNETLSALARGVPAQELGQRSLLPTALDLSGYQAIENTFGGGFFEALSGAPEGAWSGPVQSGYGLHAVRVTDRVAPAQLPFEAVRARVETDWRVGAVEDLSASVFAELEARYKITIPSTEELNGLLR